MKTVEEELSKRRIPKWALPVFGYGVSAISLVWVFAKFPFAQLGHHLRTMDWTWVVLAIVAEVLVYFADAWRWMVLLRPVGAPPFASCLQAVFVGLFANDILPARTGEIIRCFLLSYKTDVHLPVALTSDFIERIMDGVWIVLIYLAITFRVSTHRAVNDVMWVFSAVVIGISLLILWVLFHRQKAHHFVNNRSWGARFIRVLEEIHSLGHWRELGIAFAIGGVYWFFQGLAIWAISRADAFHFGPSEIAFLLVVKTVGTLAPSAPASMGLYQSSTVYALRLLLTERADAEILAEIMFGFLTLPLIIGGTVAIASAGFTLKNLHFHAHHAHSTRHQKKNVIRYQITNGCYSRNPRAWFAKLRDDVDYIQIRERDLCARDLADLVRRAMVQVRTAILVNDRIDVAIACGAAGVHLRSNSVEPRRIKALREMIVTVACHSLADAKKNEGADYAILAPIFPPLSKDTTQPALGLPVLREFVREACVPVVALGGITAANAPDCLDAGAAGIAGISLFD